MKPAGRDSRTAARRAAGSPRSWRTSRGAQPVVYGIPRGGVVVAHEVAEALGCPLDVVVVRKLGYRATRRRRSARSARRACWCPEALAVDSSRRPRLPRWSSAAIEREAERGRASGCASTAASGSASRAAGRTAIVVDDGIATGYTFAAGAGDRRPRTGPGG